MTSIKIKKKEGYNNIPDLVLACGFSGHGFGIAPSVGTVLAELANDEALSIDISELGYERFQSAT